MFRQCFQHDSISSKLQVRFARRLMVFLAPFVGLLLLSATALASASTPAIAVPAQPTPPLRELVAMLGFHSNGQRPQVALSPQHPTDLLPRAAPAVDSAVPTFTTRYFGDPSVTTSFAVGDVNGDGTLDIVQGNAGQPSMVYLNDGAGRMGTGTPLSVAGNTSSVALGDVNGDGMLDIVQGNNGQQSVVYLNDGHGAFGNAGVPFGNANATYSIALGDLNGDGALDIVQGNYGQPTVLYFNNGAGVFSAGTPFSLARNTVSISLSDMNGDGTLDIVQSNYAQQSVVYFNNGAGSYSTSLPYGSAGDYTTGVALGDLNGDGAPDIVQSNWFQPIVVYLNNGYGGLGTGVTFGVAGAAVSIALGDVNSDGALDAVQVNDGPYQQSMMYLNNGAGGFGADTPFGGKNNGPSIALGDLNGDSGLDIVQGNHGQQSAAYLNNGTPGFGVSTFFGENTTTTAVGDVNGDGTLDIVQGNAGQPSMVYLNDGAGRMGTGTPLSVAGNTSSVALGDVNGDGMLDIVQGNNGQQSVVYLNDGHGAFGNAGVPFGNANATYSIALGDLNGDGALDIVQGNGTQLSMVYLNDGVAGFSVGTAFGVVTDTVSVALGDVNGDGALDIVQGNGTPDSNQHNMVYLNNGVGRFDAGIPFGSTNSIRSIAVGDVNGDGALDIIQGNYAQQSVVYFNNGADGFSAGVPIGVADYTQSIAVGDVNSDGALDIVLGNSIYQGGVVYLNDGTGGFGVGLPFTGDGGDTTSVALGDLNGDGALDIIRGTSNAYSLIHFNTRFAPSGLLNRSPQVSVARPVRTRNANFFSTPQIISTSPISISYTLSDSEGDPVRFIRAFYSLDGGGKWYTATAASGTLTTNLNTSNRFTNNTAILIPDLTTIASTLTLTPTGTISDVNVRVNVVHTFDSDLIITLRAPSGATVQLVNQRGDGGQNFTNTVFDDEAATPISLGAAPFRGRYKPEQPLSAFDGYTMHGTWTLEISDIAGGDSGTLLSWEINITSQNGAVYTYRYDWDVLNSGFFGQSDNVVFRLEAYPSLTSGPNRVPLFQRPYASATTFPFRVRGTQVRVLSGTQPISNAIVYRLPAGQSAGALPFVDGSGAPFHTDGQGYLQGRGQLRPGDRLVALHPITATDSYTLYATSAAPTLTGLNMYTVTQAGVQTLIVSPNKPLILFSLDVSLEWDARQDTQFMTQLKYNLQRTSDFLYDWTNGQAALGNVRIYHDREKWDEAHIQIYATNRLRPNAAQGGIVSDVITDPLTSTITYDPGNVHMGAVWDRYGDPGGSLGEDWPRALAHELGHYALFLDDGYLGVNASGSLIPIDTCGGTAMSDPYREDYSEFRRRDATWVTQCASTLAAKETNRADWETITTMYRWLSATVNSGPSGLPLAVTQISEVQPITPSTVLPVPIFNLTYNGAKAQPGGSARAILYQTGRNRSIDLGSPTLDQVNARGARLGDRLCVYEPGAQRLGCETITAGDEELALVAKPGWQPEVLVTPVTSRTFTLRVNAAGLPANAVLRARLYPIDSAASTTITLSPLSLFKVYLSLVVRASTGSMMAALTMPGESNAGAAQGGGYAGTFTLAEPAPQGTVQVWVEEGGVRRETVTDYSLGGSPAFRHGRGAFRHGRGAFRHGRGAPTESSDGQVMIFGDGLIFNEGEFFALQAVSTISAQPAGTTLIGQAYRLFKSASAPSLVGTSISFNYAGRDVPPGEEDFLHVYFFNGSTWQQLATTVDTSHNVAVANIPAIANGQGLYALLSGVEIPLYGPGWNSIIYPVQGSKPVTQALASIDGAYGIVYGKSLTDTLDPWKMYAVGAPSWINDLTNLEYAQSYWISVTKPITLQVTGGGTSALSALPSPPMTVYGTAPFAGTVTAWINGVSCGQGTTKVINNQIVYTLNIQPDAPGGKAGCGAAGRSVTFTINSQAMSTAIGWDIDRVWNLPLTP